VQRRRLIRAPASSANLGPGFDAFAAALGLYTEVEVVETGTFAVETDLDVPLDRSNLVVRAFERLASADGFTFRIASQVPLNGGLGSSAAAIVCGLLAADHLFELDADVLGHATAIEGHPDNVAAALYGGFTLALPEADGRVALRRFRVPEAWIPVAFIPQRESRTDDMRAALPATVPHAAAARQAARSALLATAIMTSDAGLLRDAMADELHQPYRLPRLPDSAALIDLAYERGAAGACLSGAGPTVLAICDSPTSAHAVEKAWNAAGLPGMATRLRFDSSGAKLASAD
jgi:homoserine kinase